MVISVDDAVEAHKNIGMTYGDLYRWSAARLSKAGKVTYAFLAKQVDSAAGPVVLDSPALNAPYMRKVLLGRFERLKIPIYFVLLQRKSLEDNIKSRPNMKPSQIEADAAELAREKFHLKIVVDDAGSPEDVAQLVLRLVAGHLKAHRAPYLN